MVAMHYLTHCSKRDERGDASFTLRTMKRPASSSYHTSFSWVAWNVPPGNLHTSRIGASFSSGLLRGCPCHSAAARGAVLRRTSVVACLTSERTVCTKGEGRTWIF